MVYNFPPMEDGILATKGSGRWDFRIPKQMINYMVLVNCAN